MLRNTTAGLPRVTNNSRVVRTLLAVICGRHVTQNGRSDSGVESHYKEPENRPGNGHNGGLVLTDYENLKKTGYLEVAHCPPFSMTIFFMAHSLEMALIHLVLMISLALCTVLMRYTRIHMKRSSSVLTQIVSHSHDIHIFLDWKFTLWNMRFCQNLGVAWLWLALHDGVFFGSVCVLLMFGVCVLTNFSWCGAGSHLRKPLIWGTWAKIGEASSWYPYASWRAKLWKGWNWRPRIKRWQSDLFRESQPISKCKSSRVGKCDNSRFSL